MQPVRDLSDFVNSIRTDKSLKLRAYGLQFRRNRRRVAHATAQPSDDHEDGQRVDAETDEKHTSNTRSGVALPLPGQQQSAAAAATTPAVGATTTAGTSARVVAVSNSPVVAQAMGAVGAIDEPVPFSPDFVLRLPHFLIQEALAAGVPMSSVLYGKNSVEMTVKSFLRIYICIDQHGDVLDVVAYYDEKKPQAVQWLAQMIRLIRVCIRLQLKQSGCAVADPPAHSVASCCCHYHHPVSADEPDCTAAPLCHHCLLLQSPLKKLLTGAALSPPPNVPSLEGACGHDVTVQELCFKQRATVAAPASKSKLEADLRIVIEKLNRLQIRFDALAREMKALVRDIVDARYCV